MSKNNKKKSFSKSKRKPRARKAIDKSQNERLSAIESQLRAEEGWIDSEYRELTTNRVPQLISQGNIPTQPTSPYFYTMAQGTDAENNDHTRIGRAIKALRCKGHVTITCRGSANGSPPVSGPYTGKNTLRLLGVIYDTECDFSTGLLGVLQNSVATDAHPQKVIESFYKKQSPTKWKIWLDKTVVVPYNKQVHKVNFNYKIPDSHSEMVYDSNSQGPPTKNIMVLYAMSGVRDNGNNQMTVSAVYRCTFVK